ncbi:radical SAM family heme chaperone HemW [Lactococcus garvieae]|uniref:Heme chaperone HemW n=1 Tax=Lactococcus garvieae (strain Lg2) TaxID=420890 RepID=F9VEK9_LACGL|nr:radical SAM family heme chaperone HemW [Lactococcus garvieae]EOT33135.1 oxygen-independent coproporphyrinogen III oxidase [Lactococcus garvieae ATCC 49156]EOT93174.1 oxygen-independent coproporphyrinogen III oxidase [Lactococcus garvieae ATCC 49156]QSQ99695.1 oxygen-independent coproporphyrinogen III oxidase [Lactococcus garvieae]BAK58792.1 coproporphyrogen III oxidase [Lactococcus garvieae ATCC 49156]BAK60760.1 coproporphyrogen III oxidase [Lactococcus garvieae Lg2]
MKNNETKAAYVHIPFCSHICYYCDFAKVLMTGQPVEAYIDELLKEYDSYGISSLQTLYIGGGTPSVLPADQLEKLLTHLTKNLDLEELEEFTVEANPSDLTDEVLAVLAQSPVNRISLGVQSFDDKLLKKIGRTHTEAQVYSSIERLRAAGFENITIDLIYGLPNQTMEMVERDVQKFLELDLPHVALYSLILEDHTVFMNRQRRGRLRLPSDDRNADMYEYIIETLTAKGYSHYEVSNFGKIGYESKHNMTYWDNAEYYGVGAGASGYLEGIRYKNHGPVHHYLREENKRVNEEVLTRKQRIEEEMFLGLRKKNGVSIERFHKKFGQTLEEIYGTIIEELTFQKMLFEADGRIRMTEKGFELGNEVFERFLLD